MNVRKQKRQQLKEMHNAGKSTKEIADALGYKESSVKSILCQEGIRKKKGAEVDTEVLIGMRQNGKTLEEISRATGMSRGAISTKLVDAGYRKIAKREVYKEDFGSSLIYAKKKIPKRERLVCRIQPNRTKTYIDVTEEFVEN